MKIGTLTFHRAVNFGGIIQCYALVKVLRNLGHDAEVVDYRSKAIESSYSLLKYDSIRKFFGSIIRIPYRIKSKKLFRYFRDEYVPISKKTFYSPEDLIGQYDALIFGSDQIWSKRINRGFDPMFWGAIPDSSIKISYAASMGTDHTFNELDYAKIEKLLCNFEELSVREEILASELNAYTSKDIKVVLDPTLLLTKSDYEAIAKLPIEDNYILYYQMQYNKNAKKRIQEAANILNCKVIIIGGEKEKYEVPSKYYNAADMGPELFIGYILKAKVVFSSSFHGTALSLAMQKDIYFLLNGRNDRSLNLLNKLKITHRAINPNVPFEKSTINYDDISNLIDNYRMESMDFLKESLSK